MSDGDVLVFPEMIIYRGVKDSDVDRFVEDVLVNGKLLASGVQEFLTGTYVFVCAHNNRDRRCGVCGPVLIEKFKEEIVTKDLQSQVVVTACSHVGGHKYAGNVIIFSADAEGKISGNWYGYVTPNDVSELIDQQIKKGEIIERIWRGRMGAPVEETEKVEEPKLANGTNLNNNEKQPQESGTEEKESVGSCCQGANGFSCCRDENFEEKPAKKGPGRLSCWTGKWEQREILTAVAVVGAVATVAVAYGLYRRSR
ncbi:Sucrase/ferredoxin-like family protein [Forsythia ovata]|uniref:Sucrase/ferredoxin-like family protein n=1 Tax=Forsythia ovata TaxID=205694 RepID=A0ABD1UVB1_9LAMI